MDGERGSAALSRPSRHATHTRTRVYTRHRHKTGEHFAHVLLHELNVFMLPKCTLFSRSISSSSPTSSSPASSSSSSRTPRLRKRRRAWSNETIPKIPEHSGRAFVHTDEQLKPEQRFFSLLSFVCLHRFSFSSFLFLCSLSLSRSSFFLLFVFSSFSSLSMQCGIL